MAVVSILIPAFKPQYLAISLNSACQQTFTDIEILVGDDTADGILRKTVEELQDPRIKYFHTGFQNGIKNSHRLWELAQGKYVKWLYDDDALLPRSVECLVAALEANPDCLMAFHERVFIDEKNNVTSVPSKIVADGQIVRVDRASLVNNMVAQQHNFVGEPSNIMVVRNHLTSFSQVLNYRGIELHFLHDVSMYLHLASMGPILAVGGYLSAFRKHQAQNSDAGSSIMSAGFFEWEVFVRGEADANNLSDERLGLAQASLARLYGQGVANLPELGRLMSNLGELTAPPQGGLLHSPRFSADLAYATSEMAARKATRRPESSCPICNQRVTAWLAHPETQNIDLSFLQRVESIGSRLDKHLCPVCHCNDRDRHLWHYLTRTGLLQAPRTLRILHIAPEARLEPLIRQMQPADYVCGDLFPKYPHHHKINVEQLDFPDDRFDLIICNHVLEHVASPELAVAEFHRCLAPGGHLVAQTPYARLLKHTFELTKSPSVEFATHFFGQDDHVRLFGMDIEKLFHQTGLIGALYPHNTVLPDVDPEIAGVNGEEPFFLFRKGMAPAIG
ncbi:methyltransferase domain-containing protein [Herbaspirillum huttiense]|uniref:methyltransferase domain-containing protein n=1 Tax=Herbaspirillum huttiense TaxID=863372 RepID=UPI0039B0B72F